VEIAFDQAELKRKIDNIQTLKWFEKTKICLFDFGDWTLSGAAWLKNPLVSRKLNIQNINKEEFLEVYKNI